MSTAEPLSGNEEYFQAASEFASALIYSKAMAGAKEHGGSLWNKPVQHELWQEWADMGTYLFTLLNYQIPKMRHLLEETELARIEGRQVDVARGIKKTLNVLTYGNIDGPEENE